MLSRLALKSTAQWRPRIIQSASYWSVSSMGHKDMEGEDIKTVLARWDKANKTYFGPDRDFKKFPTLKVPEHPPPIRMGVFPSYWFDAFYEKTGVTGPYMFMTSGLVFLLSKEFLVSDHNLVEAISVLGMFMFYKWVLGDAVKKLMNDYHRGYFEKYWYEPLRESIDDAQAVVDEITDDLKCQEGQKFLYEAKKENVDLQLELAYRQRLAEVHQAVKRRLDYQVERQNAVKQFEQKHMVNWIIQNVMKSITPQQEKDTLARCIQDLKTLSATAKA